MHLQTAQVRKLGFSETEKASTVLAEAFEADSFARHLLPEASGRPLGLQRTFHLYLRRILFPQSHCYTIKDLSGVACWMPPGTWPLSMATEISLLPGLCTAFGMRNLPRALAAITHVQKTHPVKKPHWYLLFLGVTPRLQRRGMGSALLQPVLEQCDQLGIPAYLETASLDNTRFYSRHGFEILQEISVPNAPGLWGMWREPKSVPHKTAGSPHPLSLERASHPRD